MVLLSEKKGATGLKLSMQTQLHSANNVGWVPSGHTSSSLCVKLKMSNGTFKTILRLNHMFIFVLKSLNMPTKQILL